MTDQKRPAPPILYLPSRFQECLAEQVIFSGNLTTYYQELIDLLTAKGQKGLFKDGLWEIPHLVGFDDHQQVIALVIRTTGEYDVGENEYLISSLNNQWILHLNSYNLEEEFFEHCLQIIGSNLEDMHWESFMYDADGNYEGMLLVEEIEDLKTNDCIPIDHRTVEA